MHPLIYVAGRYRAATREAVAANIAAARQVGTQAARLGWYPVIPHANTAHMELDLDHNDEFWLTGTLELMTRCDAVVLVDGWENSAGTLAEIARADAMHIPVYRGLHLLPGAQEFIAWLYAVEARHA
ncbi:DUF1937 family protein [Pseudomonas sp.]|uniref:DUF1937 family protein n=1 Tax=Pseudomonas sp. TaxID=306 RepID=UPI0027319D64|nr:DUF1937 family protein [Pseudomonas sp.]MDP2244061.1 DUF1937 family protein [Pseudomonas sp.]